MEIQLNGGSIADKVEFGFKHFEKPVSVSQIFESDEMIEYAEGCDPLRSFDLQIQVRRLLYKELQHKNK